jgi:hypothetical protein
MAYDYITRAQWGASRPTTSRPIAKNLKGVALHYMGFHIGGDTTRLVRSIQRNHMGPPKGWWDIAYNELVDLDGNVFEGRGFLSRTGANGSYRTNRDYIAIGLMIGDDQAPSEAMIEATRSRIAVVRNFKPKATAIVGHSDLKATSCPGPHVRALLDSGAFEGTFASPPPLSTSPAAPYERPWWTLRIGRRGDGVKWLQWQLQRRAYKVTVDGIFGPKTRRHLKKYQRVVGLVPDGIAGPKTIRALGA